MLDARKLGEIEVNDIFDEGFYVAAKLMQRACLVVMRYCESMGEGVFIELYRNEVDALAVYGDLKRMVLMVNDGFVLEAVAMLVGVLERFLGDVLGSFGCVVPNVMKDILSDGRLCELLGEDVVCI